MNLNTKGLVIKEQAVGENDRLVTILTSEKGLIRAFVRGGKKLNNHLSSVSLFAYCDFIIYQGKDAYIVNDAQTIEVFFELRKDFERISLAQYFAQLTFELAEEGQDSSEFLRLLLNSLHMLCKGDKHYEQIKAVMEFRTLSLGGYMPNLLGCNECGQYESEIMFFDIVSGSFYCEKCNETNGKPLNRGVFSAIRFICLSDASKIFSFTLNNESMKMLCTCAEEYLLYRLGRKFNTLEFYHSIV